MGYIDYQHNGDALRFAANGAEECGSPPLETWVLVPYHQYPNYSR